MTSDLRNGPLVSYAMKWMLISLLADLIMYSLRRLLTRELKELKAKGLLNADVDFYNMVGMPCLWCHGLQTAKSPFNSPRWERVRMHIYVTRVGYSHIDLLLLLVISHH
jgi:hypothetical protein